MRGSSVPNDRLIGRGGAAPFTRRPDVARIAARWSLRIDMGMTRPRCGRRAPKIRIHSPTSARRAHADRALPASLAVAGTLMGRASYTMTPRWYRTPHGDPHDDALKI